MKSQTVKLPAFLASALVNGDTSGLHCNCGATRGDPKHCGGCDFEALEAAIAYCAPGRIVSCERESYFARCNDLPGDCGLTPGSVLDFVVLYPEGDGGQTHHDCNQVWAEMADPSCYAYETFEAWHSSHCQRE